MMFITLTKPLSFGATAETAPVYVNIASIRLIAPTPRGGSKLNLGTTALLEVMETPAGVFQRIEDATASIMLDGAHPSEIEF